MSTLHQRIVTAVVLAGLFLAAVVWLPRFGLALVFAGVAMLGAWEWALLAGWKSLLARLMYTLLLGLCLGLLWFGCELGLEPAPDRIQSLLGVACLFWSLALLVVRQYPEATWVWRSLLVRSMSGVLILAAAWLTVIYLMTLANGAVLLVLLVITVAAADVGAYFAGRRWGRNKLAPAVSPGKTWEGVWGGVTAVMAVVAVVSVSAPNTYAHLVVPSLVLLGLAVAAASVLGDLTVSMVKRHVGVKDSGALLPGHGGVLDRLDSVCGAAPVFGLGLLLMGVS